jgi:hypothetical protein
MQVIATTAAATATAVASSVGYAQPVHIQTQHFDAPQAGMEMNQMTSRPNQPAGIVQNIKHIFDHDLLLENDFYAEANVKKIFNVEEVSVLTSSDDIEQRISISTNSFDSIIPKRKASELFGGSVAGASLSAGKTTFSSGSITAHLHFIIAEGGPDFRATQQTFGDKFVLMPPAPPSFHGGPLPVKAPHGNENWKFELIAGDVKKDITLGFDEAGQLFSVLIEIKKN